MPSRASTARRELLERVARAGRENAAAAVSYHTAAAARYALSLTEEKAVDLLEREGPLTAGRLAERLRLAPASVTALVNRLEGKGFARRVGDERDRRRVLVEADPRRVEVLAPVFAEFLDTLDALYARFSDAELAVIADFLTEAARIQHDAAAKL